MSNEGRARENGYRAFISYSHRDDAAAKSLHKRLETYRLPKKLIGQGSERGPIPERLTPIFRDLDELSAADDLTVEIKAALARSATLIVLCSPGAKASKWVNLEIETFRVLHGNTRPVLAALIEGEPADAFPPALIADGQEPVAADFRKNRDGKNLALLKLVAGMAGAPLDALVQRDAQRQYRRVMAITGTALTAALAMALLLVVALRAQSEAERQRQAAEGLVEYMLTDLRDKLKGVGRLDVMTAVNERAMKYYGGQEALEGLSAGSLERRARILHAMGEDDEKRGDLGPALRKFEEARRTTAAVLAKMPDDTSAIFAHSQSEFWVGSIAYQKRNRAQAYRHFEQYAELAARLNKIDPKNVEWARELVYANGNICAASLDRPIDKKTSNKYCAQALKLSENMLSDFASNNQSLKDVANGYGWMATLHQENGELKKSVYFREKQEKVLETLLSKNSNDRSIIEIYMKMKVAFSDILILNKNFKKAVKKLSDASAAYKKLVETDGSNKSWLIWKDRLNSINNILLEHYNDK